MTTAERLLKVSEGVDKVEALNDELATSLYGGDTGYRGYYDEFWDKYQNNGNRTNYLYGFAGGGWTPQTLKPKYKIEPTGNMGISMFYLCGYANGQDVINFETIADKFDFSQMQNADNLFYSARIENIYADISNATSANSAFNCGYGAAFKNVRLKVSSLLVKANNMFDYASSLVNLIFEDSIISISLNLQWSTKLSKASITSIINALSTTTTGLSVTFSKTAVESAFGSTTSAEWTTLIGTRSNWTISLV
jgi:tetrahydromethanopterin S-methyltransferase subunit B